MYPFVGRHVGVPALWSLCVLTSTYASQPPIDDSCTSDELPLVQLHSAVSLSRRREDAEMTPEEWSAMVSAGGPLGPQIAYWSSADFSDMYEASMAELTAGWDKYGKKIKKGFGLGSKVVGLGLEAYKLFSSSGSSVLDVIVDMQNTLDEMISDLVKQVQEIKDASTEMFLQSHMFQPMGRMQQVVRFWTTYQKRLSAYDAGNISEEEQLLDQQLYKTQMGSFGELVDTWLSATRCLLGGRGESSCTPNYLSVALKSMGGDTREGAIRMIQWCTWHDSILKLSAVAISAYEDLFSPSHESFLHLGYFDLGANMSSVLTSFLRNNCSECKKLQDNTTRHIEVLHALYGYNCMSKGLPAGDQTSVLSSACNGLEYCSYTVTPTGDPCPACYSSGDTVLPTPYICGDCKDKGYHFQYLCGGVRAFVSNVPFFDMTVRHKHVDAPSDGQRAHIDCSPDEPPDRGTYTFGDAVLLVPYMDCSDATFTCYNISLGKTNDFPEDAIPCPGGELSSMQCAVFCQDTESRMFVHEEGRSCKCVPKYCQQNHLPEGQVKHIYLSTATPSSVTSPLAARSAAPHDSRRASSEPTPTLTTSAKPTAPPVYPDPSEYLAFTNDAMTTVGGIAALFGPVGEMFDVGMMVAGAVEGLVQLLSPSQEDPTLEYLNKMFRDLTNKLTILGANLFELRQSLDFGFAALTIDKAEGPLRYIMDSFNFTDEFRNASADYIRDLISPIDRYIQAWYLMAGCFTGRNLHCLIDGRTVLDIYKYMGQPWMRPAALLQHVGYYFTLFKTSGVAICTYAAKVLSDTRDGCAVLPNFVDVINEVKGALDYAVQSMWWTWRNATRPAGDTSIKPEILQYMVKDYECSNDHDKCVSEAAKLGDRFHEEIETWYRAGGLWAYTGLASYTLFVYGNDICSQGSDNHFRSSGLASYQRHVSFGSLGIAKFAFVNISVFNWSKPLGRLTEDDMKFPASADHWLDDTKKKVGDFHVLAAMGVGKNGNRDWYMVDGINCLVHQNGGVKEVHLQSTLAMPACIKGQNGDCDSPIDTRCKIAYNSNPYNKHD